MAVSTGMISVARRRPEGVNGSVAVDISRGLRVASGIIRGEISKAPPPFTPSGLLAALRHQFPLGIQTH